MLLQQGDVLIKKVEASLKNIKKLNHLVLAEGEVTGHSHRIVSGKAELYESGESLYLRVLEESCLQHEEHKEVTIPPGQYQIGIVQEYDHFQKAVRNVKD